MNKTLKRMIAMILALIMMVSVAAVGFAVSAEGEEQVTTQVTDTDEVVEEEHRMFYEVIADFFKEIFEFFKFMFYGIFLGEQA